MIDLRWAVYGGPEHAGLVELRSEVLRKPLGMEYTARQLAEEKDQMHLGAWEGNRALGCLLLKDLGDGRVQMRQVAVAAAVQKRGIGRLLIEEAERAARLRGWRRVVLHAREPVVGFYERLGYATEGAPFVEIGIPHRLMSKTL